MKFGVNVVLWNTYGECENIAVMKGHAGAVMDLHFNTDGRFVYLLHYSSCW